VGFRVGILTARISKNPTGAGMGFYQPGAVAQEAS
jgi:hypothetical protein